jgi:hypothetical protein
MELKWLEDFISLANTRSFSRSAEQRNVFQACASGSEAIEKAPAFDPSSAKGHGQF